MKLHLRRRAIPLLIAALLPIACAPLAGRRGERLAAPPRFSPYTSSTLWDSVAPAIQALQARLRAVKERQPAHVRYAFQGCYGSTFLRGNPVGNDLDFLLGVHLGTVRGDASQPEPVADEIVSRVESFLGALRTALDSMAAVELMALDYPFELVGGHFARRAELRAQIAASLRDALAGRTHPVLLHSAWYTCVPAVLSPDETYLDETLLVDMVTPCIRTQDGGFSGLRRMQVIIHFMADLEVAAEGRVIRRENLRIEPVHRTYGAFLNSLENTLGFVPVDPASAEAYRVLALADRGRAVALRVEQAAGLVLEARRRIAMGDPLKAVKRFQQAFEMIAPAFGDDVAKEVYALAHEGLNHPDLLTAVDLQEMAGVLKAVFRNTRKPELWVRNGDVGRVLERMEHGLDALARCRDAVAPGEVVALRADLERVRDLVAAGGRPPVAARPRDAAPDPAQVAPILDRVADQTKKWQPKLYSPGARMEPLLVTLERKLRDCGLVTLPVRGQTDGTLAVLAKDLPFAPEAGKDPTQQLVAFGAPPFTYRVVDEAALRAAHSGTLPPPSRMLVLRAARSPSHEQAYKRLESVLLADMERFGPGEDIRSPISNTQHPMLNDQLREQPHPRWSYLDIEHCVLDIE